MNSNDKGACYYCGHEQSKARSWKISTGTRYACDFCYEARIAAASTAVGEGFTGKKKVAAKGRN